ncbi:MAG: hypothetical protein GKS00_04240 [Alphaproteobacteria bacterium]|nr:hypothetical protein [Alphaproteobacteria bacterium]
MAVTVTPLGEDLAAEVSGIDMTEPLGAEDLAGIERAFLDRRVLRFRGQSLTVPELAVFSGQFGDLQPHVQRKFQHPEDPNVVVMRNYGDDGKFDLATASRGALERLRDGWHSDLSYDPVPAKATLLHAQEIPSRGGDTLMWENRGGVMHCGRLDYPRDERRRFIRTTVTGQAIEMQL